MEPLSEDMPRYLEEYDTVIEGIDRLEELEEEELDDDLQEEYTFLRAEVREFLNDLAVGDLMNTNEARANETMKIADKLLEGDYGEVRTYLVENYDI